MVKKYICSFFFFFPSFTFWRIYPSSVSWTAVVQNLLSFVYQEKFCRISVAKVICMRRPRAALGDAQLLPCSSDSPNLSPRSTWPLNMFQKEWELPGGKVGVRNTKGTLKEKLKVPHGRECLTPNRDYAHGRLALGQGWSKRDYNPWMSHTRAGTPLKNLCPVNILQWIKDDSKWMTTYG